MQVRSLYGRIVHKQVERCTCIPNITPSGSDSMLYSQHYENGHTLAIMMSTGVNDYTYRRSTDTGTDILKERKRAFVMVFHRRFTVTRTVRPCL